MSKEADRALPERSLAGGAPRRSDPPPERPAGRRAGISSGSPLLPDHGRIRTARFDAEGCAASAAAAAAVCDWWRESRCSTRRAWARAVASQLGGLAPTHLHAAELAADALHRAIAAAGAVGEAVAAPPGEGERVLVALSGGVDSAVAALLERERGAEVVAVTLKLWADRSTDGEQKLLLAEAVLRARRVAHSLGNPAPDARPRARVPAREWYSPSSTATRRAAPPTLASSATARSGSTR